MTKGELFREALRAERERERVRSGDQEAVDAEKRRKDQEKFDKAVERMVETITKKVLSAIRSPSPRAVQPNGSLRILAMSAPRVGPGAEELTAVMTKLEAQGVETKVVLDGTDITTMTELHVIVRP